MSDECRVDLHELSMVHGPTPGAQILHDVAMEKLEHLGFRSGGIYNRRLIRGSRKWSLHAVGRAIDLMHDDIGVLNLLAVHVIARASRLGVCEVIGPRGRWAPDATVAISDRPDHRNHVHIGITRAFAASRVDRQTGLYLVGLVWAGPSDEGT